MDQKTKSYKPYYGFSAGFRAIRSLNESVGLETGISLGSIGEKYKTSNYYNIDRLNFISIPFLLQQQFTTNKLNFFIGFGINYNAIFFSSEKHYESGRLYYDSQFGFYSIFGIAARGGIIFKMNKETNFILSPSFRYQIFSITGSGSNIGIHPYSVGLEIGFSKLLIIKKKESLNILNSKKNIIYLEGLGPGLFYSLNYERTVMHKKDFKLNLRSGVAFYPNQEFAIPIGVNFAYGRAMKIEAGIYSTFQNYFSNSWGTNIVPSIGGRLESRKNLFLRVAYTPMYHIRTRETLFSFGVSIGKLF